MKLKLFFVLIFFLATANRSFGQIRFKNDPKFAYYFDSLLVKASILHPKFNEIDFELRYWIRDLSRTNAHQLLVIQKLKTGEWKFRKYQLCFEKSRYEIVDFKSGDLPGWETVWKQLVRQQILKLKSEKEVQGKWKSSKGTFNLIADGTYYAFELTTLKSKRQYFYTNPEDKLKDFDINNIELVCVNQIINLLNDRLDLQEGDRKNVLSQVMIN